jgi:hypothetical protein
MEVTPIDRNRFYRLITEVLSNKELTAREIAEVLFLRGYIMTATRQEVAPRLTELEKMDRVEVVGSKVDVLTKKRVSIYRLCGAH